MPCLVVSLRARDRRHRLSRTAARGAGGVARASGVRVRPARIGTKVPAGASIARGDALAAGDLTAALSPGDTLVHLVGTPRPSPAKAQQFQDVDLPSIRASVEAAVAAGVSHIVYVSVAHPAPMMHAYIAVREQGEALVAGNRHSRDDSSSLVRARSRTLVALRTRSAVLARRADPRRSERPHCGSASSPTRRWSRR